MAGELNLTSFGVNPQALMSGASQGVQILLGILIITIIVGFFLWWFSHKHIFVGKNITGNGLAPDIYHAREYADRKTGVRWWSLRERNHKFPRPPDTILSHMSKNKFFAMGYITDNADIIWAEDPQDFNAEKAKIKPFSPNQRVIFIEQLERAYEKKNRNFFDKHGSTLITGIFAVILIGMLVSFWGDISKPFNEAVKDHKETVVVQGNITQMQRDITERLASACMNQQPIGGGP